MLINADRGDVVEPAGVVDEDALALGQNGIVGGIPGDAEPFGDTSDGEVLADDCLDAYAATDEGWLPPPVDPSS